MNLDMCDLHAVRETLTEGGGWRSQPTLPGESSLNLQESLPKYGKRSWAEKSVLPCQAQCLVHPLENVSLESIKLKFREFKVSACKK